MITAQQAARWITAADYGQKLIYHVGRLCNDADISMYDTPDARELYNVRKQMKEAFDNRNVYLFQRRIGDNKFEYIAIRRSNRRRNLDDRIRQSVKRIMEHYRNVPILDRAI